MSKEFQFEQFEDTSVILQFLSERDKRLTSLLFSDNLLYLVDSRFPNIGGFTLYVKEDGTMTTNILDAVLKSDKERKVLESMASSYQTIQSLSLSTWELRQAIVEYRILHSNYSNQEKIG